MRLYLNLSMKLKDYRNKWGVGIYEYEQIFRSCLLSIQKEKLNICFQEGIGNENFSVIGRKLYWPC